MGGDNSEMPEDIHHYYSRGDVPWDIQNYWHQRYQLFSKYDEGILLTDDAWFGVTPEKVANKIAEHMSASAPKEKVILIDAFAGAGGNTIAFALSGHWKRVYAIEKNPTVLKCAKRNAEVYGVADKITWFEGDCFEILRNNLKDLAPFSVIFASPPWGGPGYRSDNVFNLSTMQPYSLKTLYDEFSSFTKDMAMYLPRSSNLKQLAKTVDDDDTKAVVMHYCADGASKALCIYYGGFRAGMAEE
ncbi:hypothetical protein FQN54_007810 [Arachnomyces sp. PD_36]|nr:hypothetical protein FQN54_007810 [Arachnomyces sp. PD_36]